MTATTIISNSSLSLPPVYTDPTPATRRRGRRREWRVVFVDYDGVEFDEVYLEAWNAEQASDMALRTVSGEVSHVLVYPCE